ncbi:hypothetical protein Ahy_B02g060815 [Arachis hypogaea]|uniref:Aminotransferase-like plant mobile domain-containing protein n=1 Tax=Arachis hypogaea TaxID=3818 RepID=A0A445AJD7_ARAHY|nr:hypothetical protein Ahy_B02g060815 [Arachis hypogaea]
MIGMSLFDVAAITGLPISPRDFTSDMQPERQYNITSMTSYSEFIAHHMGAENDPITDDEHMAFLSVQMHKLFYPLASLLH